MYKLILVFYHLFRRAETEIVVASKKLKVASDLLCQSVDQVSSSSGSLSHLRLLKHLDLSGTSITSLTLSLGLQSPDLRYVRVSECVGGLVTDHGLVEMCRRHRRISHLNLSSSCITDLGLLSSISHLPRYQPMINYKT